MNNEIEFSALAHNLLLKTGAESTARQAHKNHIASTQASPQAAKKKTIHQIRHHNARTHVNGQRHPHPH
jgi:hypothetical protein